MKAYLYAAAVLLLAVGVWYAHRTGYQDGYAAGSNAVKVDDATAKAAQQKLADQHQSAAAAAGNALQVDIATTIPAIEVQTHDRAQAIHTVYLGLAPAAADACRRPDGVQHTLAEALDRANAAARGDLRPGAPAGPASAAAGPP